MAVRTRFELADAVNLFGAGLLAKTSLTPLQSRVLGKIAHCRTASLGGHEEVCDSCGTMRYSYNPAHAGWRQALPKMPGCKAGFLD